MLKPTEASVLLDIVKAMYNPDIERGTDPMNDKMERIVDKLYAIESREPVTVKSPRGNQYQDGLYRLWLREDGALQMKLDNDNKIYYISKDSTLYGRLTGERFGW